MSNNLPGLHPYWEAYIQQTKSRHRQVEDALSARVEELEAKLVKALGALVDIHDGEPEWPEEPQKELDWCRERARTALEKMKEEKYDQ